jgi:hypothetical protein
MMTHSIIISYSPADEQWKDLLLLHLENRQMQAIALPAPGDERVGAGIDRRAALEKGLINAEAAVLLVSADYLTSGYILKIDIPRLLERRAKNGLAVFPLIVSACPWQTVDWLQKMRIFPKNGEPLSAGAEYEIEDVLENLVETIHRRLKHGEPSHHRHPGSLSRLPVTDAPSSSGKPKWRYWMKHGKINIPVFQ